MENKEIKIDAETLRIWLEEKKPVFVLDIRPKEQREEWQIPGSHYLDAYKRLNEGDKSVLDEIEIPENTKVITVCAAGRTSQIASDALRQKGIKAWSLEGGMKAWGTAWNVAQKQFTDFEVVQIRRTGKGCLSYIISSNTEAIIVDPSLPLEVYVHLIKQYNLSVKNVIETHIHADHLSRSKEVSAHFGVPLFLPVPNKVQFPFNKITEDTIFSIGTITLQTLPTPGHTFESVSFYIENSVVFTGDTLFTNGVGRPDLKASEEESRKKSALLYHSLKKLLLLPDQVLILPAHTNKPVEFDGKLISTSIDEAKKNIPLLQSSENDFIDLLLQKIPPTPANYLSIVEKNLTGDFSDINPLDLEAGANRCAIA
ncbi:MBL fold metallo-hydrolase [Terrimonas pollutisoli]|uniref:MBL fold metallo-hydrolase n=1 Tax=Terrimonas pollutisoli TaxID=3034147 RepID=UPI0023EB665C|nr:MBL fold metallo-hydrolase [Terrimonas sp. H1YJ31]